MHVDECWYCGICRDVCPVDVISFELPEAYVRPYTVMQYLTRDDSFRVAPELCRENNWRNMGAILQAAGSGLDNLVKTTVFLTDLKDFEAMNAVYARYFGAAKPARSTVQVAALPRGARVEIEATARVS